MHRFVFNKPSKMFSRHYDDGNRVIFLQETNTKNIHYRNYKTFNANLFKQELNNELLSIDNNNAELVEFINTILSMLDKHVPIKRKYIRANNSSFMTKELRVIIMQRSEFSKDRTNDSKHLYNRPLCQSFTKNETGLF